MTHREKEKVRPELLRTIRTCSCASKLKTRNDECTFGRYCTFFDFYSVHTSYILVTYELHMRYIWVTYELHMHSWKRSSDSVDILTLLHHVERCPLPVKDSLAVFNIQFTVTFSDQKRQKNIFPTSGSIFTLLIWQRDICRLFLCLFYIPLIVMCTFLLF